MPARRVLAPLLLVACALLAGVPTASADPAPLPPWVMVPAPVVLDPPPTELADSVEQLARQLGPLVRGPDPGQMVDARYATVTFECRVDEAGQRECRGMVCRSTDGEGDIPVALGLGDDGEYGVGVDPSENPDGSYGPYDFVRVSLGGNCGCTAWVKVLWLP